jgi:phage tail-like protein
MARNDSYRQFNFRVEIDGVTVAGFQEVSIPNTRTPAVAYRAGNDPPHVRKVSEPDKPANITLKRGLWLGSGQESRNGCWRRATRSAGASPP